VATVLLRVCWKFVLGFDEHGKSILRNTTICKNLSITPYNGAYKTIRYIVLHYCAGRTPVLGGNTSEFGLNSGRGRSFIEPCDAKARMPKSSGIGRNVRTLLGLFLSLSLSLSLSFSLCSISVPGNRDAFQGGAQLLSAMLRVLKLRFGHVSRITSGGLSLKRLLSQVSKFSMISLEGVIIIACYWIMIATLISHLC